MKRIIILIFFCSLAVHLSADRAAEAQASARRVEREEDLAVGVFRHGRVGDYVLANEKVAFVIEAVSSNNDGYHQYGGLIADAGRAAPDGRMSFNRMGEMVPVLNGGGHSFFHVRTFQPESVEIVSDGSNGGEAVLRFEGADGSFKYVDEFLPQKTRSIGAGMTFEYRLGPEDDFLTEIVTIANNGKTGAHDYQFGHAYFIGDGVNFFLPNAGFDAKDLQETHNPFIALEAPEVSYGLYNPDNPPKMLFNYGNIIIGLGPERTIGQGEAASFVRKISVGGGDVASAEAPFLEPGQAAWLKGEVVLPDPAPRNAAAFLFEKSTPGKPRTIIRTDEKGRFETRVPSGEYEAFVWAEDHPSSARSALSLKPEKKASYRETLPEAGRVSYEVKDETGRLVPCALAFNALELRADANPVAAAKNRYGSGFEKIHFSPSGAGSFFLTPGRYEVFVSRGLEYEIDRRTVDVKSGAVARVDATIAHSVNTAGWLSGDFHLHAQASPDSDDLNEEKIASLMAVQLEVPVSTDHDVISDYAQAIRGLEGEKWIGSLIGEELTTLKLGHFNGFPLRVRAGEPNGGAIDWSGLDGAGIFQAFRDFDGDQAVQINHPRSGMGGYLDIVQFDPSTGVAGRPKYYSDAFDALEVFNGKGGGELPVTLADWYAYLNMGMKKTACGNSDSHRSFHLQAGYPRNMVRSSTDDPSRLDAAEFVRNVKSEKIAVNGGHFIEAALNGARETLGETFHAADGRYTLHIRAQSPSWIDLTKIEIVENGATVQTIDVPPRGGTVKFEGDVELNPRRDAWYVVHTYGKNDLYPVYPGAQPRSFTNPFWIDADGDGKWEPVLKPVAQ